MYIPFLRIPDEISDTIFYWDTEKREYTFGKKLARSLFSGEYFVDVINAAGIRQFENTGYTKKYGVPESCFTEYSKVSYDFEMSEKKIFIMENHASAILAWFKLQQGSKCNLITFDEHTDTVAPLLRYKNSVLEGDEETLLKELRNMKNNLTETLLKGILANGVHLKSRKNRNWGEALRLWNDEHITTAIFLS